MRGRSRRESLLYGSRVSRCSKNCPALLIWRAGSGSAPPAQPLSGGSGGTAPRSAGLAPCDPPGPAATASTAFAESKNKQTTNPQETRKEGGRELSDLPPTSPGRHRKPAGPGASAEPPPARPPGLPLPGKSCSGDSGKRGTPRSSPCRRWARAGAVPEPPDWREAARPPGFFPLEGKATGNGERCISLGFDCVAVSGACCPAEQQVLRGSTLYRATGERGTGAIQPGPKHNTRLGPWVAVLVLPHGAPACRSAPVAAHLSQGRARDLAEVQGLVFLGASRESP